MSADLREIVRKYALQNAALHKGSANPKAVVGKVMGEVPELRSRSKEVSAAAEEICAELCGMDLDDIITETESINPDLLKKTKSEKKDVMIDLPNTENGVVMRMAPGPSGPCTSDIRESPSSTITMSRNTRVNTSTAWKIPTRKKLIQMLTR